MICDYGNDDASVLFVQQWLVCGHSEVSIRECKTRIISTEPTSASQHQTRVQ